jgi:hypothetical protein
MTDNVYKKRPAVGSRPVFFVEEPECKPEKLKKTLSIDGRQIW